MSDQSDNANPSRRRMSLVDMFSGRPNLSSSPPSAAVQPTPDTAQHKRGNSISTFGLAGANSGPTSPYNAFAKQRRASIATSSASGSPEFRNSFSDEPAVLEEDNTLGAGPDSPPNASFARRLSFGAQALRDVRQSGSAVTSGGRRPSSSLYTLSEDANQLSARNISRSPETAKAGGEGFNWSEALRDKTKRSPSFSSGNPFTANLNRAKPTVEPPKEIVKPTSPPMKMKKPDHIGERMLRGDFMMD